MGKLKEKYAIVMELEGAMDTWTSIFVFDTEQDCHEFMRKEFSNCLYHGEARVAYGDKPGKELRDRTSVLLRQGLKQYD